MWLVVEQRKSQPAPVPAPVSAPVLPAPAQIFARCVLLSSRDGAATSPTARAGLAAAPAALMSRASPHPLPAAADPPASAAAPPSQHPLHSASGSPPVSGVLKCPPERCSSPTHAPPAALPSAAQARTPPQPPLQPVGTGQQQAPQPSRSAEPLPVVVQPRVPVPGPVGADAAQPTRTALIVAPPASPAPSLPAPPSQHAPSLLASPSATPPQPPQQQQQQQPQSHAVAPPVADPSQHAPQLPPASDAPHQVTVGASLCATPAVAGLRAVPGQPVPFVCSVPESAAASAVSSSPRKATPPAASTAQQQSGTFRHSATRCGAMF